MHCPVELIILRVHSISWWMFGLMTLFFTLSNKAGIYLLYKSFVLYLFLFCVCGHIVCICLQSHSAVIMEAWEGHLILRNCCTSPEPQSMDICTDCRCLWCQRCQMSIEPELQVVVGTPCVPRTKLVQEKHVFDCWASPTTWSNSSRISVWERETFFKDSILNKARQQWDKINSLFFFHCV